MLARGGDEGVVGNWLERPLLMAPVVYYWQGGLKVSWATCTQYFLPKPVPCHKRVLWELYPVGMR
jgi:hypothetical protein